MCLGNNKNKEDTLRGQSDSLGLHICWIFLDLLSLWVLLCGPGKITDWGILWGKGKERSSRNHPAGSHHLLVLPHGSPIPPWNARIQWHVCYTALLYWTRLSLEPLSAAIFYDLLNIKLVLYNWKTLLFNYWETLTLVRFSGNSDIYTAFTMNSHINWGKLCTWVTP